MKNSSKAQDKRSHNKQLYQRMENIEREWDTYKRVKPRSKLLKRSTGGGGSSCDVSEYSSIITSLHDQILENSPRSLMSSLQESRRKSPISDHEGLIWKVRNNDIAVQEILRERRAALASGKLKGRRLFEASSEDGEDICSECFDYLCHQESEVRSLRSYGSDDEDEKKCFDEYFGSYGGNDERGSCLNSSLSEEKMEKILSLTGGEEVERNHVKEMSSVQYFGANLGGNNGRRWKLAMAWFAVVTMAFTLGLISISCSCGYLQEEKVFLIPT